MRLLVATAVPSPYMPNEGGWNDTYGWGVVSAVGVLDTLYPPAAGPPGAEEDPAGCACDTGTGAPLWMAGFLAVAAVARRRAC
ncbi:MAG: hypothetical protein ACK4YP_14585 [Myxococcota bacterium]